MRTSVHDVLDWLRGEVKHPSRNWQHLCQQSARSAWGLAAYAPSARKAWEMTPERYRHYTPAHLVPPGAICYGLLNTTYGHAWIAGHNGMGFAVDYRTRGRIDRVPLALPAWTHDHRVHWVDHVPVNGKWTPLPL